MQIDLLHHSLPLDKVGERVTALLGKMVSEPALANAQLEVFESSHLDEALSGLRQHNHLGLVLGLAVLREPLAISAISDLMDAGASDVIEITPECTDADLERLRATLSRHADIEGRLQEGRRRPDLVGESHAWLRALREIALTGLGRTGSVVLRGETGTGKEGVARWIHAMWGDERPWVVVDCAASVDSLWSSELFGYRKGSFTGAFQDRDGALARAHGGTLFLDEVGELRPSMQSALLRVLQERAYTPIGASAPRATEFRVICATSRDLESMVQEGTFRRDLYERLAGAVCWLPPLRERGQDAMVLLRHFLGNLGKGSVDVDPRVVELLQRSPMEGNTRQLKNIAATIADRLGDEQLVRVVHLPRWVLRPVTTAQNGEEWNGQPFRESFRKAARAGVSLSVVLDAVRDEMVRAAVDLSGGGSAQAAARIGVSERMVQLRRRAWLRGCSAGPALEEPPEPLDGSQRASLQAS